MKNMKKWKKMMAGLVAVVMVSSCVPGYGLEVKAADTLKEGDYSYEVNSDGKSVTLVQGYTGDGGNITIPSEIAGKKVTGIGKKAFDSCDALTGISIPNSVTSIGDSAFVSCGDLTSVSIPNSVVSIGSCAFMYCYNLTKVNLPDSVTSIEGYVFFDCNSLASITIPNSVTRIGIDAFYECDSLKSITIPSSVTNIRPRAVGYEASKESEDIPVTKPGFVIYGYSGSAAETYAKENNIKFVSTGTVNTNTPVTCKKTVYEVSYGAKPFKIEASSKGKLEYTSSDAGIAAIDKNTGMVTIKGTGIATITAKAGNNSVKVTVKVSPKKASLKSVKAVKGKKLTVKWAKDKNASGYQVQVSTAKNFKKNMKQKNVAKTSYTFPKLKAGKKYYVRVRSYKKSGKETLYGAWSGRKQSGKVKK